MNKKCGGQLKLTDLNLLPENATDVYSWVLQKPAAAAGQEPELICTNETKAQKIQQQNYFDIIEQPRSRICLQRRNRILCKQSDRGTRNGKAFRLKP